MVTIKVSGEAYSDIMLLLRLASACKDAELKFMALKCLNELGELPEKV